MAKTRGIWSAFYLQTTADSVEDTAMAMAQVGTTLWYQVTSSSDYFWDKAKAITVYDGVTIVTPLEIDYAAGAVRLAAEASGAVTADAYKFACAQLGGFRSFSLDESMELIECGCFEDDGEVYEPGAYSASGSGEGFWSSVDAYHDFNGLTLLAKPIGTAGNAVSAKCVVSGNSTPLSISVAGNVITINSATNVGGSAISKNWEIKNAIEASAAAAALVRCRYTTNYATNSQTVMGALTEVNLAGGAVPEMLSRFGEEVIAVFYWDSGASLIRTSGLITFEDQSVDTSVKGLVGKNLKFKALGLLYDHAG
jgi:hypothetical protein